MTELCSGEEERRGAGINHFLQVLVEYLKYQKTDGMKNQNQFILKEEGTLGPWDLGTLGPWDPLDPGTLGPWEPGTLGPRNPGNLGPWDPGTLRL